MMTGPIAAIAARAKRLVIGARSTRATNPTTATITKPVGLTAIATVAHAAAAP